MEDRRLLTAFGIFIGLAILLAFVGVALANNGGAQALVPDSAFSWQETLALQTIPTPENPLPDVTLDLIGLIQYMISSLGGVWYLILAVGLFAVVAFLRGKLKLGSWPIKIPGLSDWFENAGSKVKFWLIIGFTGLGCAFAALVNVADWTVMEILKNMFGGFASGVTLAFASMGMKSAKDVHFDPKHPERKNGGS